MPLYLNHKTSNPQPTTPFKVKLHEGGESNAAGEGLLRLHGRRDAQGHEESSEEEEVDANDPEDVARHERLMAASANKSFNEDAGGSRRLMHKDRCVCGV